ncbi:MAG: hypothetical protein KKD39_01105, partial [Candidatus Altiarchaeota archaeon]|nr:hypothetical protein [Candidatus Altiarchaeota archaeon]
MKVDLLKKSVFFLFVSFSFYWFATAGTFEPQFRVPYYNYMTDAFLAGQLHLLIEPSDQLLSLDDPYDPSQNAPYRLGDAALYKGHYYVVHGPTASVLLFVPWKIIFGTDFPTSMAVL